MPEMCVRRHAMRSLEAALDVNSKLLILAAAVESLELLWRPRHSNHLRCSHFSVLKTTLPQEGRRGFRRRTKLRANRTPEKGKADPP